LGQGTAKLRVVMDVLEKIIDGSMWNQTVMSAFECVEEYDVQGISDPVGAKDHIVFQGIVILTVTAEADAQVIEPAQKILLVVMSGKKLKSRSDKR
jgi:hypothetical protein